MPATPLTPRRALPFVVLALGVAASAAVGLMMRADAYGEVEALFGHEADDITNLIRDRLDTLGLVLRGAAGAFADPINPQPAEWKIFTQQMQPQLTLPGVLGIGLAQIVLPDQVDAHLAKVRGWGFPDYRITPEGPRDIYTSIVFIEPFDSLNQRAFGYDMYTDAVRRTAMDLARDTGMPALSGRVTLVQEDGVDPQAGALLYFPLYLQGPARANSADRQTSLVGWTYSPLRMTDFIGGMIAEWQQQWRQEVDVFIYDGNTTEPAGLIYSSIPGFAPPPGSDMQHHAHRTLYSDGRQWTLMFDYAQAVANVDTSLAWVSFGGGLIISGLLSSLLLALQNVHAHSQQIAARLTADLRTEQQHLEESEYRWKFALEGSGDGMWDWNVPEARILYSTRWKAMLGYADSDLGDTESEWSSRIHPDDQAAVMQRVQDYLDGRTPSYQSEHRMLCKDGSYKWILDRGMVVARDSEGRPLRMLGTHKDMTHRRLAEVALEQKQSELLQAQRIGKMASWTLDMKTGIVEWTLELYRMLGMDPAAGPLPLDEVQRHFTAESWEPLAIAIGRASTEGVPYEKQLEYIRPDGSHGFMLSRGEAVRGADGSIYMLRGTVTDITELILAEHRIQLLNRLYRTLSSCNDAIVHCRTVEDLLARACEIVAKEGNMTLAWIGLIDKTSGDIVPRYWSGAGSDYLHGIHISVRADDPSGQGPTGTSTRENRPVWINDFRTDPMTRQWQHRAHPFGWISSAALPLCQRGQPIGTLTFYSTEANWFSAEIRALLEEMAVNIGFALDKLEIEAEARRYEATLKEAEQRFRSLVEQPLVGAFIVQNKRFVYVNPYMETLLGYAHDGSLCSVLPRDIISTGDRPAIQSQVDRLLAGEISNFEAALSVVRADASLLDVGMTISAATYLQQPAIIGLMQDLSNRQVAEAQIKRYANNLEKVFLQTVGMVTNLVEMRDPYTVGHEMHVSTLAVAIGQEMDLPQQQLEGLRVGGYLHDVGKVAVPAEILAKPGRITTIEYELIKGHPEAGYQILKDVEFPWPVADIAYQHHERFDGSGYPRGLKGDDILLEARIIAVADVVESMFSHRPYRPGLGIERALAEIEQGRGSRYDPAIADCCLRLFREKGFKFTH